MALGDNTKLGYYYSGALHIFIAVAMFAYALIEMLFPKEVQENKIVFDMVEPSQTPPSPPAPEPEPIKTPDLTPTEMPKIAPIDIPEPEPEPEPESEPEPTPTPTPEPTPSPEPAPKKEIKKPQPKKISFENFRKKNPKKATTRKPRSVSKPVKIGQITARTSNLDNISTISSSSRASSSAAMQDALSAYTREIYLQAKRNWKIPTISEDTLSAKISFKVSRLGTISAVRIVVSSGDKAFDASVVEVFKNITIPPPPDNDAHDVTIVFKAQ